MPRKILIALDLDFTHYYLPRNPQKPHRWIGSKDDRIAFYQSLREQAEKQGVAIVFALVTRKIGIDPVVLAAISDFRSLLPAEHYKQWERVDYCAVTDQGVLKYLGLNRRIKVPGNDQTEPFPLVHVSANASKGEIIASIARAHEITDPADCFLLDDTQDVLNEAASQGIQIVSHAWSHCDEEDTDEQRQRFNKMDDIQQQVTTVERALQQAVMNRVNTPTRQDNDEKKKLIQRVHTAIWAILAEDTFWESQKLVGIPAGIIAMRQIQRKEAQGFVFSVNLIKCFATVAQNNLVSGAKCCGLFAPSRQTRHFYELVVQLRRNLTAESVLAVEDFLTNTVQPEEEAAGERQRLLK